MEVWALEAIVVWHLPSQLQEMGVTEKSDDIGKTTTT